MNQVSFGYHRDADSLTAKERFRILLDRQSCVTFDYSFVRDSEEVYREMKAVPSHNVRKYRSSNNLI